MLVACLGDTHFGVRSDSLAFHAYFSRFYTNTFFPYLREHGITTIIQTGDMFDRRKFVNFNTLQLAKQYFFDRLDGKQLITYPGNHDIFFRNTLQVNSIDLLLQSYTNITNYREPATIELDGTLIDIIPWICRDNEARIRQHVATSRAQICFGHFQLDGFEMDKGRICTEGMNRSDLAKYEMVITGHFHHKSTDGHIWYVGAPCEHTWADYDDPRGFHILDTSTRELTFIANPYRIHHKVIYNDGADTMESIRARDYSPYAQAIVKVIVQSKSDPYLFDQFLEQLYQVNPLDVSIIEDFSDTQISDEDVAGAMDDTLALIGRAVDGLETNLDRDRLKNVMRDVWQEATALESAKGVVG